MKAGSHSALNNASAFFERAEFFVRRLSLLRRIRLPVSCKYLAFASKVEYMASWDMSKSFGSIEALVSALPFGAGDSMWWNGSLVSLLSETGPVSFDVLA
jgi:hypothetical protein